MQFGTQTIGIVLYNNPQRPMRAHAPAVGACSLADTHALRHTQKMHNKKLCFSCVTGIVPHHCQTPNTYMFAYMTALSRTHNALHEGDTHAKAILIGLV